MFSLKEEKKICSFFQKTFWPLFLNEKFETLKEMQRIFSSEEISNFFQLKGAHIFEISLFSNTISHFEFLMENLERKIILLSLNSDVLKSFCIILNGYEKKIQIGVYCNDRLQNFKKKLDAIRNLEDKNISYYLDLNVLPSIKEQINKI